MAYITFEVKNRPKAERLARERGLVNIEHTARGEEQIPDVHELSATILNDGGYIDDTFDLLRSDNWSSIDERLHEYRVDDRISKDKKTLERLRELRQHGIETILYTPQKI